MEKSGMGRRIGGFRHGLLGIFLLFLFFAVFSLYAEDETDDSQSSEKSEEETQPPAVHSEETVFDVEISAPHGRVNVLWTLSFLVDYPYPSSVFVYPPEIPEELTLEEVRTEPRLADGERRTIVAFTFTPHYSGVFTLAPFSIAIPQKRITTSAITVVIGGEKPKKRAPYLVWNAPQPPLTMGERVELSLKLFDWDATLPFPHNVFHLEAPEQAILEEIPLNSEDISRSIALRLALIPLEGDEIVLPRAHFQYESYSLETPPLRLKVIPAEASFSQKVLLKEKENGEKKIPEQKISHTEKKPFPKEKASYKRKGIAEIAGQAEALWDSGKGAEALALIRRAERDYLGGSALVELRRAVEAAAGLAPLYDELRVPKKLCSALFFCILCVTVFVILASFFREKGKRKKNTALVIGAVIALAVLFLGFSRLFQPKEAVLYATQAFSAPETSAGTSGGFGEGQCVFVRSASEGWAFVETPDNRSGWVARENLLFY